MRTRTAIVLGLVLASAPLSAQTRRTLDIYVVDVEGGNATLFVTPTGESVLIDAGNGGAAATRDAGRILDAARDAGLTQIDHHVTTHWHGDYFGALAELARQIPIKAYYDHGPTIQPQPASTEFLDKVYPTLVAQAKRTILKAGDRIPIKGLDWRIVTSGGQVLQSPLPAAGARNPYCATNTLQEPDPTENAQSVGSHITFGRFRVVHPGDLTWNKEVELMCPANRLGTADLLIVGHHGQAMRILLNSPGLEDAWQSHFSLLSGQEYTVPGMFIGNMVDEQPDTIPVTSWTPPPQGQQVPPPPAHDGKAYWFKVSAQPDGAFSVTNTRNSLTKTYRSQEN